MGMATLRKVQKELSAKSITRLLVASYFIATAFGLIQGTNIAALAQPFLAEPYASLLMSGLVLGLCAALLTDFHRRPAMLLLSLTVFWASYLTILAAPAGGEDISAFWRDIALIGALLAAFGKPVAVVERSTEDEEEDEVTVFSPRSRPASTLFREDLKVARSS